MRLVVMPPVSRARPQEAMGRSAHPSSAGPPPGSECRELGEDRSGALARCLTRAPRIREGTDKLLDLVRGASRVDMAPSPGEQSRRLLQSLTRDGLHCISRPLELPQRGL